MSACVRVCGRDGQGAAGARSPYEEELVSCAPVAVAPEGKGCEEAASLLALQHAIWSCRSSCRQSIGCSHGSLRGLAVLACTIGDRRGSGSDRGAPSWCTCMPVATRGCRRCPWQLNGHMPSSRPRGIDAHTRAEHADHHCGQRTAPAGDHRARRRPWRGHARAKHGPPLWYQNHTRKRRCGAGAESHLATPAGRP